MTFVSYLHLITALYASVTIRLGWNLINILQIILTISIFGLWWGPGSEIKRGNTAGSLRGNRGAAWRLMLTLGSQSNGQTATLYSHFGLQVPGPANELNRLLLALLLRYLPSFVPYCFWVGRTMTIRSGSSVWAINIKHSQKARKTTTSIITLISEPSPCSTN